MKDTYSFDPDREQRVLDATSDYEFKDNLPKQSLFVKFSPSISESERDFISNGIRNYFLD